MSYRKWTAFAALLLALGPWTAPRADDSHETKSNEQTETKANDSHPVDKPFSLGEWMTSDKAPTAELSRFFGKLSPFDYRSGLLQRSEALVFQFVGRRFADKTGNESSLGFSQDALANIMLTERTAYLSGTINHSSIYLRPVYVAPPTGTPNLAVIEIPPIGGDRNVAGGRAYKAIYYQAPDRLWYENFYVSSNGKVVATEKQEMFNTPLIQAWQAGRAKGIFPKQEPPLYLLPNRSELLAKNLFPSLAFLPDVAVVSGKTPEQKGALAAARDYIRDVMENTVPIPIIPKPEDPAPQFVPSQKEISKTVPNVPVDFSPYIPGPGYSGGGPVKKPEWPEPQIPQWAGEFYTSGSKADMRPLPPKLDELIGSIFSKLGERVTAVRLDYSPPGQPTSSALLLAVRDKKRKEGKLILIPFHGPLPSPGYQWVNFLRPDGKTGASVADFTDLLPPYFARLARWKKGLVTLSSLPQHDKIEEELRHEGLVKPGTDVSDMHLVYAPDYNMGVIPDPLAFSNPKLAGVGSPSLLPAALAKETETKFLGKNPIFTLVPPKFLATEFPEIITHEAAHVLDDYGKNLGEYQNQPAQANMLKHEFDQKFAQIVQLQRLSPEYRQKLKEYVDNLPKFLLESPALTPQQKWQRVIELFERKEYGDDFSAVRPMWREKWAYFN